MDKTFGLGLKKRKIKIPKKINYLVSQRNKLRKMKNWKEADDLRNIIKTEGFDISDTEKGTDVFPNID